MVVAVLIIEGIVHHLEMATADSPFSKIIRGIQRELMIAGGIGFLLKCVLSTSLFDQNWVHAVEFADIFVPVTGFLFCFLGCVTIGVFYRESAVVSAAFRCDTWELLHSFYEAINSRTYVFEHPSLCSKMEYHFARAVFTDEFEVLDDSFPFDAYLTKVFEKYLVSIIDIEPINWILVIIIVCVNWVRVEVGVLNPERGCRGDAGCVGAHDIRVFTYIGFIMLGCLLIVAIVSRYYQLRCLYGDVDVKGTLCLYLERHAREADGKKLRRLSNPEPRPPPSPHGFMGKVRSILAPARSHHPQSAFRLESLLYLLYRKSSVVCKDSVRDLFVGRSPGAYFKTVEVFLMIVALYGSLWICNFVYTPESSDMSRGELARWKVLSFLPLVLSAALYAYVIRASAFLMAVMYKDEEVMGEVQMERRNVEERIKYVRESILQHLIELQDFDGTPAEFVASVSLVETKLHVSDLFDSANSVSSTHLTKDELHLFLASMGITFSASMWRRLMHAMDTNGDDKICSDEFVRFLFSEHAGVMVSAYTPY